MQLDPIILLEKTLLDSEGDKKYSFESKEKHTIKVYSREYSNHYHYHYHWNLNGMIERQIKKTVKANGDVVYGRVSHPDVYAGFDRRTVGFGRKIIGQDS